MQAAAYRRIRENDGRDTRTVRNHYQAATICCSYKNVAGRLGYPPGQTGKLIDTAPQTG